MYLTAVHHMHHFLFPERAEEVRGDWREVDE